MTHNNNRKVSVEIEEGQIMTIEVAKCWQNEQVHCYCTKCAKPFYSIDYLKILKAKKYQSYLNPCEICGSPRGFDYVVFEYSPNAA